MIATDVATPFSHPHEADALRLSLLLAIPYVLYQVGLLIAPALYEKERRMVLPLVVASTGLFYLGMAFAYFVVFPLLFAFFSSTAPQWG